MKQKGSEWVDANGKTIPTYAINPVLKVEEKHAQKIAQIAAKVENLLKELNDITGKAYTEVYNAKCQDAKIKGNKTPAEGMTINSFDNSIEIKMTKPETTYFDNTYTEMVKAKFDEYFSGLNAGNDMAILLKDIVNDLMFTSGGKLDNSKVLQLRKYRDRIAGNEKLRTKGAAFIEAVDLFDKAIKTKPGNPGLYVSVAENPKEKKRRVAIKYTDI